MLVGSARYNRGFRTQTLATTGIEMTTPISMVSAAICDRLVIRVSLLLKISYRATPIHLYHQTPQHKEAKYKNVAWLEMHGLVPHH